MADADDIVRAAKRIGLKARRLRALKLSRLAAVPLPAIIAFKDGQFGIIGLRRPDGRLRIGFPWDKSHTDMTLEELDQIWSGEVILVTRRIAGAGIDPVSFGFRWFLTSVWRYRTDA